MTAPPRVLIIEDDENKRSQLLRFVSTWLGERGWDEADITTARSFRSGLVAVLKEEAEVILLDMTMPTYDVGADENGGRPQAYAGREILRQMDRRDIRAKVVVVTQFDRFGEGANALTLHQLDDQLRATHPDTYRGAVYYDIVKDRWRAHLSNLLTAALRSGSSAPPQ